MYSKQLTFLFGFLTWLIPFLVSFIIFPVHQFNRPLFESIMPLAITAVTVLYSLLYFKKVKNNFLREGIILGTVWSGMCVIIDFFFFAAGPMSMRMSFSEYVSDIGLTYLIIPIITIGTGFLLERR